MAKDLSSMPTLVQAPMATANDIAIVQMAFDICRQLSKRHKKNRLHFDIRPQSIRVDGKGRFHLAEPSGQMDPQFAAPEMVKGSSYSSYNCDTYSLGLLMYWLLNDRRAPFCPLPPYGLSQQQYQTALNRRLSGEPLPPPAHGSEELKALVLRACAPDPNNRFQTAREMEQALIDLGYKIKKPIKWGCLIPGIILGILAAIVLLLAFLVNYFVDSWISQFFSEFEMLILEILFG